MKYENEQIVHEKLNIGVVSEWIQSSYHFSVIEGIDEEAVKHNYQVYYFIGSNFDNREIYHKYNHTIYNLINNDYLDYLIILPGIAAGKILYELKEIFKNIWKVPLITLNFEMEEYSSVLIDNKAGFNALISHIIETHSRERLVFIKGPDDSHDANERFDVFREVLISYQIPLREELIVENGLFINESGADAVKILLDERNLVPGRDFDAIIAANDAMAVGAVTELTARKIRVPEDIAVGGFDDSEQAKSNDPPLTTVRQLTKDQGAEAVKLIADIRRHRNKITRQLPTQLIIRESCGCNMMNQALTYYTTSENLKKTTKRNAHQDKVLLSKLIKQAMISSLHNDEYVNNLIAEFVETFLLLVNDKNSEQFISSFNRILMLSKNTALEVITWHKALAILKNWLHNIQLPDSFIRTLESILDAGNLAISTLYQKEEMKDHIEYESYLDKLRIIEDACKISMEMDQLFNIITDGLLSLGFSSFYLFFYNKPADYSHDYKLMLFCTDRKRNEINFKNRFYKDFTVVINKLLIHENIRSYLIFPLVEGDDVFGFIILNKSQTKYARIIYENISSRISSSLKSIKLINEIKKAYRKLEQTQRELEQEIEVARNLQRSLLPEQMFHNDFEMAAEMITAISVGGDYYDFITAGEKSWIVIGDVSGHGVHAGLITMMVQTSIHIILKKEPDISPLELLTRVNEVVTENIRKLGETKYMTILVLAYDNDGYFTFSGMHLPLLILRARTGKVEIIETDGIWLGLLDNINGLNYQSSFHLDKGDTLLLYTDGVTEAMCHTDHYEMYGFERLVQLLEAKGNIPLRRIINHIIADLSGFSYDDDDVTLFALRRK